MDFNFKPIVGYQEDTIFKRILVVSHVNLVWEFVNAINYRNGIKNFILESPKLASLYIIRIFCYNCSSKCQNKTECSLKYEFILINDNCHLKNI